MHHVRVLVLNAKYRPILKLDVPQLAEFVMRVRAVSIINAQLWATRLLASCNGGHCQYFVATQIGYIDHGNAN